MDNTQDKDSERTQRDALCPECGHAFKVYMDRVIRGQDTETDVSDQPCPVCGCGKCDLDV